MKKQKTITQLRHEADRVFSLAVRYRDCEYNGHDWVGNCITCDTRISLKQSHCGHFMSRRFPATRWSEENCNLQCPSCNTFHNGEQYKYGIALDLKYGEGTAERLHKESQQYFKVTRQYLEEIIADAKEQIHFYENQ